jgi:hypothetical protein
MQGENKRTARFLSAARKIGSPVNIDMAFRAAA